MIKLIVWKVYHTIALSALFVFCFFFSTLEEYSFTPCYQLDFVTHRQNIVNNLIWQNIRYWSLFAILETVNVFVET